MECQTCKDWEEANEYCGTCCNQRSNFYTVLVAPEHTCVRFNQEYLNA